MAKRTQYEVKPSKSGGWDGTRNGQRVAHQETKAPVVEKIRREARNEGNSQVKIKGGDGRIQEERTYGKDPYPPKG